MQREKYSLALTLLLMYTMTSLTAFGEKNNESWQEKTKKALGKAEQSVFYMLEPKTLADAKKDYIKSAEQFNHKRNSVRACFSLSQKTIKEEVKTLSNSEAQGEPLGQSFYDVNKTYKEIEGLRHAFENMVRRADTLFVRFDERAESISNEDERSKSLSKVDKKKNYYVALLLSTKSRINDLEVANRKIDDFLKYTQINFHLGSIDGALEETYSEVDGLVSASMKDIDTLMAETNSLVKTI